MDQPTQQEYCRAIALSRDPASRDESMDDYYQVCRWYRGLLFRREAAERGLKKLRSLTIPATGAKWPES